MSLGRKKNFVCPFLVADGFAVRRVVIASFSSRPEDSGSGYNFDTSFLWSWHIGGGLGLELLKVKESRECFSTCTNRSYTLHARSRWRSGFEMWTGGNCVGALFATGESGYRLQIPRRTEDALDRALEMNLYLEYGLTESSRTF